MFGRIAGAIRDIAFDDHIIIYLLRRRNAARRSFLEDAMEQPLLEIRDLTASFRIEKKWVVAIKDIEFSIHRGETLGIVGESGCGKSVTSMSILRLFPKTSFRIDKGEVLFSGRDLTKITDHEMSRVRGKEISMIFQDSMTSLNPVLTVGNQLEEAFLLHGTYTRQQAEQKAIEFLTQVGIPSPERRIREYPHQLSGGMRQRVMIAMALAQRPPLIIADEPTTALDVTIQAQIMELLKTLKRDIGSSIMLITHDMGVVADMADRILVMYAGMTMETGTARDIFKNPLHPYTQGLLAAIPRKDKDIGHLYSIEGTVPSLQTMPQGCRFCDRCTKAMERCHTECPGMIEHDGHGVRCFLYADKQEG